MITPSSSLQPQQTPNQIADLFGVSLKRSLLTSETKLTAAIAKAKAAGRDMDAVELAARRMAVRAELAHILQSIERTNNENRLNAEIKSIPVVKPVKPAKSAAPAPATSSRVDVLS